ncbi:hypothetical protein [Lentimicrobium sp. S6]|uniref:hypothetical protein n=1 Tax=Lentimicrobium sp. S6 TaxID=2735872 RepID=UPI001557CEBF|nr:hypothetical protein [Lentimicrobium sp. S6]NPD46721.1 hypothetical protein [Lentimicrobium sp. S6]
MKAIKTCLGFILGLLISLVILDQFISKAQIEGTSPTDFDTIIGRKRRANLPFTFFNEGFSMGNFNEYSYLGPAYNPVKEPNHLRIAILGDSYVESFQVFRRDQFHQIIENTVTSRMGDTVEVLNFGRSGFDWADMYAYQKRMVARFNPDITIFMISDADLICTQTDPLIPKVIERNSQLIVTNELIPKAYLHTYEKTKILTQNSSVLAMFNNCRKLVKAGKLWPKMLDKFYWVSKKATDTEPQLKSSKRIPDIAFKILDNLPSNSIIVNRGTNELDSAFMQKLYKNAISFIDIRDTLSVLEQQGFDPHYWPVTKTRGHWNHQAHQAVGLYLSHQIECILIESPDHQFKFR